MKQKGTARAPQMRQYAEIVRDFASSGAKLIGQSITERYHGAVSEGTRLLEPGYIPPDRPARVLIVSYFPNASDTYKPGTPAYEGTRNRLKAWGDSGSVEDYRASYEDWLEILERAPFHKQRTKPILEDVGLRIEEIGWIPFIKAPMPAGSSPGDEILRYDKDETWAQLLLIKPSIVWIQGVAVAERVKGLVKERITDRILPPQSLSQYGTAKRQAEDREKIARHLAEYLKETSSSEG